MGSYFTRVSDTRYLPTEHAIGAWDVAEMHFSPLGGLIVHSIERHVAASGGRGLVLARVGFDILGRLALDECEITVETVRPGRTIELVEASVVIGDRRVVTARAWFLAAGDTTAVEGGATPALPSPETLQPQGFAADWPGGFVASLETRPVVASTPGRGTLWLRTGITLVEGESSSPLADFVALVDAANGVAVRQSPAEWLFPNVDLTIHLHRQPAGGWVGLDTTVVFGPTGQGVTSSVLHDTSGPIGHAHQLLTVRPLS
jgi:hypothetical protein